jgi:dolichyl-phosphate beta-glucosyltransferase
VLDEVYQYLTQQNFAWEVVIVNDESTDGSKILIERSVESKRNFSLFDIPHGGKPAAIWAGIQKAQGELVLTTDMDQSTPIGELSKLLPWCEQGFDVVIGSRGIAREGFSFVRRAGSFVFGTLRGVVLLRNIADTQCGFKLYRRQVVLKYFPYLEAIRYGEKPSGWKVTAFDIELLYLIEKAGYRIKEVVVSWSNRDQSDTKSQRSDLARYVNESVDMAQQVMRVKLNQLRGLYDAIAPSEAPSSN